MTSKRANHYPPELRERAVRMPGVQGEHGCSNEVIHQQSWKNRQEVELATLPWVDWYNNRRRLERLGHIPPAEAEKSYYASIREKDLAA